MQDNALKSITSKGFERVLNKLARVEDSVSLQNIHFEQL